MAESLLLPDDTARCTTCKFKRGFGKYRACELTNEPVELDHVCDKWKPNDSLFWATDLGQGLIDD